MERCAKCILPESVPHVTFDAQGVCNYCLDFVINKQEFDNNFEVRRTKLLGLLEEKKERRIKEGLTYDVLVPLSGGRDSSYVAWKLAVQYKLKVLCVNYANPFSSTQAIENVKNVAKAIAADLETFSYPHRIHEKSFHVNLNAWAKKPDLGTLGLICLACKPMYLEFYRIAKRHKIELIVDGSNIFEVTTFKMEAQAGKGAKKQMSLKTITKMLKKIVCNPGYLRFCNIIPVMKTFLSLNGGTAYLRWKYPNITKMGFFYAFPYNEKEINETLAAIGWKKAQDNESPWRFDCEIDSLKNYIFHVYVGASEKDDLFSKYIRAGLMAREEAIKRLDEGEVNPEIVKRILGKVGIDKKEFDKVCFENLKAVKTK